MRNFYTRTVKNGSVVINGCSYVPSAKFSPVGGTLDGRRYVFGVYPKPTMVSLWGSEAMYQDPYAHMGDDPDSALLLDRSDGIHSYINWSWWYAKACMTTKRAIYSAGGNRFFYDFEQYG